jgi:hypothetical protein
LEICLQDGFRQYDSGTSWPKEPRQRRKVFSLCVKNRVSWPLRGDALEHFFVHYPSLRKKSSGR